MLNLDLDFDLVEGCDNYNVGKQLKKIWGFLSC
jgi:hypothetical protein